MCDCIRITFNVKGEEAQTTLEINVAGIYNGQNYYQFEHLGGTFYIFWSMDLEWHLNNVLSEMSAPIITWRGSSPPCPPFQNIPETNDGTFESFTTEACQNVYGECCIQMNICFYQAEEIICNIYTPTKDGSGRYTFEFYDDTFVIYFTGSQWNLEDSLENIWAIIPTEKAEVCPAYDRWDILNEKLSSVESTEIACPNANCGREDRMFREYKSIKLPISFTEQKRGFKDCCCEQIVLASSETESWKNDVTSAWIKLSGPGDSALFKLKYEDGTLASMLSAISFINEPNAFYATVDWAGYLGSFGEGCYKIEIEYNISGITGTIQWGTYKLKRYSIQNALTTARVSAVFDGYHETEGINFSGSNVPSTFRFHGFIGFRQPNYEIDNLIYQDRQMKRNLRENLNSYEISTDPSDECIIKPLVELYLLSENELYISDYNAHNHSYRYLDLPVIVEESPKIEYTDQFARKAVLKCNVGDKFKNKRTYY